MTSIQGLPNEVLLNIFRLGCDDPEFKPDPSYGFDRPSHARKRKQLIAIARLVCFRWHQLVDLRSLPYGCHFWLIHLSLSLRKSPSLFDTDLVAPNTFLSRLTQFRELLSASQGCDLVVNLDADTAKMGEDPDDSHNILDSYQDAPLEDQLSIKLFLFGAFEVLQQRNQILAIQIRVKLAPLQKHMVELLAGLVPAYRLKLIQISAPTAGRYHAIPPNYPPLRSLTSFISVPGFGALNPRALHAHEQWGLSLMHLAHLDILCIPLLWLQDLNYHFTVSRLFVWMQPNPEVELFATVFAPSPLRENLRELTITWPAMDPVTGPGTGINHQEIPTMSFNRLTRLEVQLMPDSRAYWFFAQIDCPQLTEAVLLQIKASYRFLTRSKWAPTKQNRFPQLAVLQITFSQLFSPDSLYLLDLFKYSPVERLGLWNIGPPGEYTPNGSTKMAMHILSHFEPGTVDIDASCLKAILAVLGGLSCHLLQEATLSIRFDESENPSSSPADNPAPFKFKQQVPRIIDLPLLSTLVARRMTRIQVLELLQQIKAENLQHLSLNINPTSYMTNNAKPIQKGAGIKKGGSDPIPPFPSLRSMKLHISMWEEQDSKDAFLPKLWETTPNLEKLKLVHADSSPSTLPDVCKLIFASLNSIHILSSEEEVPTTPTLLYLSLLDVTYPVVIIPGLSMGTERDVEVARIEAVNSLVARHAMGAIPLELTEFLYDPHDEVLKFCAKKKKNVRA